MTFDARSLVPLGQVASEHGGKAAQLRHLIEQGLPVPDGFAISSEAVLELLASSAKAGPLLHTALQSLGATTVAVRSSALQEDGEDDSFAGIFTTELNVPASSKEVQDALANVVASAGDAPAAVYMQGATDALQMGVIVQCMVDARVAGVAFTDAVDHDGATVCLIEAASGLGESVVGGRVRPTRITAVLDGGPIEAGSVQIVGQPLLSEAELNELLCLLAKVRVRAGAPRDVEWALDQAGSIWLLQSRPITRPVLVPMAVAGSTVGAAPGQVRAPTFVVNNLDEVALFPSGHILVAEVTETDYLPAMRQAAAIVTEEGGVLSHAGIVAREIGIPCVVGRVGARRDFPTGTVISVDGSIGKVTTADDPISGHRGYVDVDWAASYLFDRLQERRVGGVTVLIEPTLHGPVVHAPPDLEPAEEAFLEAELRKRLGMPSRRVVSEKYLWHFELKRFHMLLTFRDLYRQMRAAAEELDLEAMCKAYRRCHLSAERVGRLLPLASGLRALALGELGAALHFLAGALVPEGFGLLAGYSRVTSFLDEEEITFAEFLAQDGGNLPGPVAASLDFLRYLSEERNRVFGMYRDFGTFTDTYFERRGNSIADVIKEHVPADVDLVDLLYNQADFIRIADHVDGELRNDEVSYEQSSGEMAVRCNGHGTGEVAEQ